MILTVLRAGGDFRAAHVHALRAQVLRHAPGAPFMCLTDDAGLLREPWALPLRTDWPGWWAKIEAFGVRGPCLYMDLDTVLTGGLRPLLDIAASHDFVALADFDPGSGRGMASGLMGWRGDLSAVFAAFAADPAGHMAANATPRWWGDQGFIERAGPRPAYWQDLAPGAVVSWKRHCADGAPAKARVVCFHGKPRPWEIEHGLDRLG